MFSRLTEWSRAREMLVIAKVFKKFSFLCAIRGHFRFFQILYGSPVMVSCGYNSLYIKLANIKSEVSNEPTVTGIHMKLLFIYDHKQER